MRKAEYRKSEILTGMFVVVAALVFGLFAFEVGSFDVLRAVKGPAVRCVAEFAEVRGLVEGAPVAVGGRNVGEVTGLEIVQGELSEEERAALASSLGEQARSDLASGLTRQAVRVSFELRDGNLRLDPRTARVSVSQDGLLGGYFLSLDPGYWEGERAPALEEHEHAEELHLASSEGPGMDAVLARLAPAIENLGSVLRILEQDLLSVTNLEQLSRVLADLQGSTELLRRALDREDPEGLHATIVQPLGELIGNADESLTELSGRLLDTTLVQAETLIGEGSTLVANLERLTTDVSAFVGEVNPGAVRLLEDLDTAAKDLDASILRIEGELAGTLELVQGVFSENRPEVAESLRRLRRTMWEAEMAMRKIRANPAYLLFGDDETLLDAGEVEAVEAIDAGALERSGRVRPYGQRDEGEGGE